MPFGFPKQTRNYRNNNNIGIHLLYKLLYWMYKEKGERQEYNCRSHGAMVMPFEFPKQTIIHSRSVDSQKNRCTVN